MGAYFMIYLGNKSIVINIGNLSFFSVNGWSDRKHFTAKSLCISAYLLSIDPRIRIVK